MARTTHTYAVAYASARTNPEVAFRPRRDEEDAPDHFAVTFEDVGVTVRAWHDQVKVAEINHDCRTTLFLGPERAEALVARLQAAIAEARAPEGRAA